MEAESMSGTTMVWAEPQWRELKLTQTETPEWIAPGLFLERKLLVDLYLTSQAFQGPH